MLTTTERPPNRASIRDMLRRLLVIAYCCVSASVIAQTRAHPYDLVHVKWHVSLDQAKASVVGDVTNVVRPTRGVKEVWFDKGRLSIASVAVDGKKVAHRLSGEKVVVPLPADKRSGRQVAVRIKYSGRPD